MPLEIRLLRHAVALARHGNFARAAEALALTQPSLSRSIAGLEGQLGVRLFDRTTKGVHPTEFGRLLLERSSDLLQSEADLRSEIRALAGLEGGRVRVMAGPYPGATDVAIALGRLSRAHPKVAIECITTAPAEVVRNVLSGRCDVGVSSLVGVESEPRLIVERRPVRRYYLACRAGHPLAGIPRPRRSLLQKYPLVTTVLRGEIGAWAADVEGSETYLPPIFVNSVDVGMRIARESDALFLAPWSLISEHIEAGRLATVDHDDPKLHPLGGLFYLRERSLSPAAIAFVTILHEVFAEADGVEPKSAGKKKPKSQRSAAVR